MTPTPDSTRRHLKKLANEFADKFTGFGSYIGDLPDDDLELNALIAFLGDREPH
jgi:hypothetical protein